NFVHGRQNSVSPMAKRRISRRQRKMQQFCAWAPKLSFANGQKANFSQTTKNAAILCMGAKTQFRQWPKGEFLADNEKCSNFVHGRQNSVSPMAKRRISRRQRKMQQFCAWAPKLSFANGQKANFSQTTKNAAILCMGAKTQFRQWPKGEFLADNEKCSNFVHGRQNSVSPMAKRRISHRQRKMQQFCAWAPKLSFANGQKANFSQTTKNATILCMGAKTQFRQWPKGEFLADNEKFNNFVHGRQNSVSPMAKWRISHRQRKMHQFCAWAPKLSFANGQKANFSQTTKNAAILCMGAKTQFRQWPKGEFLADNEKCSNFVHGRQNSVSPMAKRRISRRQRKMQQFCAWAPKLSFANGQKANFSQTTKNAAILCMGAKTQFRQWPKGEFLADNEKCSNFVHGRQNSVSPMAKRRISHRQRKMQQFCAWAPKLSFANGQKANFSQTTKNATILCMGAKTQFRQWPKGEFLADNEKFNNFVHGRQNSVSPMAKWRISHRQRKMHQFCAWAPKLSFANGQKANFSQTTKNAAILCMGAKTQFRQWPKGEFLADNEKCSNFVHGRQNSVSPMAKRRISHRQRKMQQFCAWAPKLSFANGQKANFSQTTKNATILCMGAKTQFRQWPKGEFLADNEKCSNFVHGRQNSVSPMAKRRISRRQRKMQQFCAWAPKLSFANGQKANFSQTTKNAAILCMGAKTQFRQWPKGEFLADNEKCSNFVHVRQNSVSPMAKRRISRRQRKMQQFCAWAPKLSFANGQKANFSQTTKNAAILCMGAKTQFRQWPKGEFLTDNEKCNNFVHGRQNSVSPMAKRRISHRQRKMQQFCAWAPKLSFANGQKANFSQTTKNSTILCMGDKTQFRQWPNGEFLIDNEKCINFVHGRQNSVSPMAKRRISPRQRKMHQFCAWAPKLSFANGQKAN